MEQKQVVKAELADILKAYESIFKAYQLKESEQVSDKTKYSKTEALQEVMESIIKNQTEIEKGKEYHYLRRAVSNKMRDAYDHEGLTEIFKGTAESDNPNLGILEEMEASKGYGLTKAYVSDILRDIRKVLTVTEYEIWEMYTIQDVTAKVIADHIGETEVSVCRKIKKIFNKIQSLHIRELLDVRYVNALHPKRRSYYRPHEEENGAPHTISREAYDNTPKTPVKARQAYKQGTLQTVFLKYADSKELRNAINIRYYGEIFEGNKNKELIQLLMNQAQVFKSETKGVKVKAEYAYTGPADKLLTYRIGGILMKN